MLLACTRRRLWRQQLPKPHPGLHAAPLAQHPGLKHSFRAACPTPLLQVVLPMIYNDVVDRECITDSNGKEVSRGPACSLAPRWTCVCA